MLDQPKPRMVFDEVLEHLDTALNDESVHERHEFYTALYKELSERRVEVGLALSEVIYDLEDEIREAERESDDGAHGLSPAERNPSMVRGGW